MDTKMCKQCGETKPVDRFRSYYGGRKGTYNTCLACEKINTRYKYLKSKYDDSNINEDEMFELEKIYKLYNLQKSLGLHPPIRSIPGYTHRTEVDVLMDKYEKIMSNISDQKPVQPDAPAELLKWLVIPLDREPEYYQVVVYEWLLQTYRPVTHIDQDTMLPVRDDTYKPILDQILTRFDDWEDAYYADKPKEE